MGLTRRRRRLFILSLFAESTCPRTIVSAWPARVIADHQLISLCGLVQFPRNLVIVVAVICNFSRSLACSRSSKALVEYSAGPSHLDLKSGNRSQVRNMPWQSSDQAQWRADDREGRASAPSCWEAFSPKL